MDDIGRIYSEHILTVGLGKGKGDYHYKIFCSLVLDQKLRLLQNSRIDFLVLETNEKDPACFFVQSGRKDNSFRLEAAINADGRSMLYGTDTTDFEAVRSVFTAYLNENAVPDISGWEFVGEFRPPDK